MILRLLVLMDFSILLFLTYSLTHWSWLIEGTECGFLFYKQIFKVVNIKLILKEA